MIIFYNPECSKCREAKDILEGANCAIEIRNYLEIPPTKKELEELIALLGCDAGDLVRKKEALFLEKYADEQLDEAAYIELLLKHPELLERPIVIEGQKAIIGRPPQLVLNMLGRS